MRIQQGATKDYFVVLVEPGEVMEKVTYPTWAGCFTIDGKIDVWEPAASHPRAWKKHARKIMERAYEGWKNGTLKAEPRT